MMMILARAGLAGAAFLSASLTLAAPMQARDGAEAGSKVKLVCKHIQSTGWRLHNGSTVCRTRAQWAAIRHETQKQYRDYNRGGSIGSIPGRRGSGRGGGPGSLVD
jgi:hypothetical protein